MNKQKNTLDIVQLYSMILNQSNKQKIGPQIKIQCILEIYSMNSNSFRYVKCEYGDKFTNCPI